MSSVKKALFALMFISFCSLSFGQGGPAKHLKKGDMVVGGKVALGGVYGADVGFVGNFEYGFQEDFLNMGKGSTLGLGGSIGYSSYSETFNLGGFFGGTGEWTYTNLIFLATGYWHLDVMQVEELDTYATFSVGFNNQSVEWSGSGTAFGTSVDDSGLAFGFGVGGRYYINSNLAIAGEAGIGMGYLRVGIDYKL